MDLLKRAYSPGIISMSSSIEQVLVSEFSQDGTSLEGLQSNGHLPAGTTAPALDLSHTDSFVHRHIGPTPEDQQQMLYQLGFSTLDALIDQTVPRQIRRKEPLQLGPAVVSMSYWLS